MFGKRSIGILDRDVAPSTTMASEAMRIAIPLRRARRVSHMGRLRAGRRGGADLLFGLDEVLALQDDLLPVAEALDDFDTAVVRRTDLDRRHLHDAVADYHHRGLGLAEADRLARDTERAPARLHQHLHAREQAWLEPAAGVGDLHLDSHRAAARVEVVHDAGDRPGEHLALIGIDAQPHR